MAVTNYLVRSRVPYSIVERGRGRGGRGGGLFLSSADYTLCVGGCRLTKTRNNNLWLTQRHWNGGVLGAGENGETLIVQQRIPTPWWYRAGWKTPVWRFYMLASVACCTLLFECECPGRSSALSFMSQMHGIKHHSPGSVFTAVWILARAGLWEFLIFFSMTLQYLASAIIGIFLFIYFFLTVHTMQR